MDFINGLLFLVRYILADLISFLGIERLQLAGSSSTVFAANLIQKYFSILGNLFKISSSCLRVCRIILSNYFWSQIGDKLPPASLRARAPYLHHPRASTSDEDIRGRGGARNRERKGGQILKIFCFFFSDWAEKDTSPLQGTFSLNPPTIT